MQILSKLANIMPLEVATAEYLVSLTDFIGKGFDREDDDRIVRLVRKMNRIVREASIVDGFLRLRLNPEALALLEKMAAQVRIAWGPASHDFRKIRAFVDGCFFHNTLDLLA